MKKDINTNTITIKKAINSSFVIHPMELGPVLNSKIISPEFNGNFLTLNLSKKLFLAIKSIISSKELYLYNKNDEFVLLDEDNLEDNNPVIIPLGLFANQNLKFPKSIVITNKRQYEYKFCSTDYNTNSIVLNKLQKEFIKMLNTYSEETQIKGIPMHLTLHLPCGFGKTVLGVYLSLIMGFKTLVIVNRKLLMKQWAKHFDDANLKVYCSYNGISNLFPKLKKLEKINLKDNDDAIEKINKKTDLTNIDVLIIPDKHLKNKEFCLYLINNFSICFIDESHKYNLSNNNIITYFLSHYYFKYLFSLTATPTIINKLFFGFDLSLTDEMAKKLEIQKGLTKKLCICNTSITTDIQFTTEISNLLNNLIYEDKDKVKQFVKNYSAFNRLLFLDMYRNDKIVKNIKECLTSTTRCIVLVYLIDHRKLLFKKLSEELKDVLIIDGCPNIMKNLNDIIDGKEQFIIIGTDKLLNTGLDISVLNTIHLTTGLINNNEIIQTIGRLERINEDDYNREFFIYNFHSYNNSTQFKFYFNNKMSKIISTMTSNNWIADNITIN